MAIYHLHAQIIGRGGGRSAVASAAYRHCARMEIEAEARIADYSNKKGLTHSEFSLPEETPAWLRTLIDGRDAASASAALWNAVEAFEKRADAQFMREMDLRFRSSSAGSRTSNSCAPSWPNKSFRAAWWPTGPTMTVPAIRISI